MKLSISSLLQPKFWLELSRQFQLSFQRFPIAMVLLLTLNVMVLVENHDLFDFTKTTLTQVIGLLITSALWSISVRLYTESNSISKLQSNLVTLLPIFFFAWIIIVPNITILTVSSLVFSLVLSITFSAYVFRQHDNASFWYFNYQVMIGVCFGLLAALIFCGGVSLILISIGYLFSVDIDSIVYMDVWSIGMLLFAPLYLIVAIPQQFDYPREECEFPNGVRFIQQYVLTPLAVVYLIILYAYFIKIIFVQELPQNHLGKMISTFGVIGIISHIFMYPVYHSGKVMNWFYRIFYYAMFMPILMLFYAISIRIKEYGVTELRYLIVLCAVWFLLLSAMYLIQRKNFKLLNTTAILAVLMMIASAGPWSLQNLPVKDQFDRLITTLEKNQLLVDGNYVKPATSLAFELRKDISSSMRFLISHGQSDAIKPWFPNESEFDNALNCSANDCNQYNAEKLAPLMGFKFINRWVTESRDHPAIYLNVKNGSKSGRFALQNVAADVSNALFYVPISVGSLGDSVSAPYDIKIINPTQVKQLTVSIENSLVSIKVNQIDDCQFNLDPILKSVPVEGIEYLVDDLADYLLQNRSKDYQCTLQIAEVIARKVGERIIINSLAGYLILSTRK